MENNVSTKKKEMENKRRISSSSTFKPHFFKVLFKDFETSLRIPDGFLKHLAEESTEIATLVGPSGNSWYVKVNSTNAPMYLEDGWETFYKDHSLKKGEFLVFRYDGNMQFSVKIFSTSACQREDAIHVKPTQLSKFSERIRRRGRPCKAIKPKSVGTEQKKIAESELQIPHSDDNLKSSKGKLDSPSTTQRSKKKFKKGAEEAAKSFTSHFPYFVSLLMPSAVHIPFNVTIPVVFAREHLSRPNGNNKLEICNEKGRIWEVSMYVRKNQVAIRGGFKSFVEDNHLKVGDYCVFELIDHSVLLVHIYRC